MRYGLLIAAAIGVVTITSGAFGQPSPAPSSSPGASSNEQIIKKIEEERQRFEQQQKETDELFDKTIGILNDQHKDIETAERAVNELIARVEGTIAKTKNKGELMNLIDVMINDAIDGKSKAQGLNNGVLMDIFAGLEAKYRDAKQRLIDESVDAESVLQQLKDQKDVIALAKRASNLQAAYEALNQAIAKFHEMVQAGKRLLQALPKPPGT